MRIFLTRHGQTRYNAAHLMQGRTDEPLNENGIAQAESMRRMLLEAYPGLSFDAVYASPLGRAVKTGAIIGGVSEEAVVKDDRLLEADFGKYELKPYAGVGPAMGLYWALPEIFPAPRTVESVSSMIKRSRSFLQELEEKEYETVLVACHGGILRTLRGYMEDRPRGFRWRPKPRNCEVLVYESERGRHRMLADLRINRSV